MVSGAFSAVSLPGGRCEAGMHGKKGGSGTGRSAFPLGTPANAQTHPEVWRGTRPPASPEVGRAADYFLFLFIF